MGLRKRIICYELKFDTLSCICYTKKIRISNYVNHLFTTKGGKLMPLVQVREKAQITIPSKIRKALGIRKATIWKQK